MYLKFILFLIIPCSIQGALLFWSKTKFKVSPLKNFNDDDFNKLLETMGNPETFIYRSSIPLPSEFKDILNGYYSSYNPSGDLSMVDNVTDISEYDLFKDQLKLSTEKNVLSVVILPHKRVKRQVEDVTTSTQLPDVYKSGPVVYHKNYSSAFGVLMYSSQSLLLEINNTYTHLGQPSPYMITVDTRDQITKLNVNVPQDNGVKVTLNFLFYTTRNNYWSLTAVKVSDTTNQINFNLTVDREISAPARFSYHCSGETIFRDVSNNVELHLYDLQVQIDAIKGRFSDANDCIPFTTAPIWSGLFVTGILGIVLIIGITAMFDIKTMDKFDNQKTKQLSITVAAE